MSVGLIHNTKENNDGFNIIDAHSHLWLRQDTEVNGLPIRTLTNGRSLFMGEERQMVPPFMIDGRNSAEVFSRTWTMHKYRLP